MATKTKNATRVKKPKVENFEAHYLAVTLVAVLVLEGVLFGAASAANWQSGAALLDVSTGVSQTVQDFSATIQPMIDVVANLNEFYQSATTQMAGLMNFSNAGGGPELSLVYDGVSAFYDQAATQMAGLMDLSNGFPMLVNASTVAGLSAPSN